MSAESDEITRVKANALGAWKRESARPSAITTAQPTRTSKGKGSRSQPTDPLYPMTRAKAGARARRLIALGRFFHG
jgi:hypothetical protein